MKLVLTVVFGFFACVVVEANECRRVVRVQQIVAVQQQVYATPVVAAVFAPVAVTVPLYSVGGYAPAPVQQLTAPEPTNSQLLDEVRRLQKQVEALTQQPQFQKKEAIGEHPGVVIMKNRCAACHGAAAKEKGNGFALVDGAAINAKLTDKQALDIARHVYSGRMPKNGKLTDDEVGHIMDWLDLRSNATKQPETIAPPKQ